MNQLCLDTDLYMILITSHCHDNNVTCSGPAGVTVKSRV